MPKKLCKKCFCEKELQDLRDDLCEKIDNISVGVSLDIAREVCCTVVGWANVNSDGTLSSECGGVTSSRNSRGIYSLVPPVNAETLQLTVLETAARDSIEIHPLDFIGTTIQIHEGDNGTPQNSLRDRPFTAVWYGREDCIKDVTIVQANNEMPTEDKCLGCLDSYQLDEQGTQFFANFRLQVFNTCTENTPSTVTVEITGANYSLPNINGQNGVTHIESGIAPNITHTFTFPAITGNNNSIQIQENGLTDVEVTGNKGLPLSTGITLRCD